MYGYNLLVIELWLCGFFLTELGKVEDDTFKQRRQKEFEVRRMRTVSASME